MKKAVLVLIILFVQKISNAQTDTISFYIDGSENTVEQKNASYLRVGMRDKGFWRIFDLYLHEDKVRMKGFSKDDSLKIKEGVFEYYYKSGKRLARRSFVGGKQHGLSRSWYESGQLQDSAIYQNGVVIGEEKGWHEDGSLRFLTTNDTIGNGDGTSLNYYSNGVMRSKGDLKQEKRDGIWSYYRPDKTLASEVTFEKDSVIGFKAFDEKGVFLSKVKDFEREADYKGGEAAWNKYMSAKLSAIYQMAEPWKYAGSCTIQFIVDQDGNVTNVETIATTNENFSKLAMAFVQQSRKWIPAIQYNLPVKAWRRQKFTFTNQ
jgi:antitoxin component YwqK of YwqJK toxin-antitoxin module